MNKQFDLNKAENTVMPKPNGFNSNQVKMVVEKPLIDRNQPEIKRMIISRF